MTDVEIESNSSVDLRIAGGTTIHVDVADTRLGADTVTVTVDGDPDKVRVQRRATAPEDQ